MNYVQIVVFAGPLNNQPCTPSKSQPPGASSTRSEISCPATVNARSQGAAELREASVPQRAVACGDGSVWVPRSGYLPTLSFLNSAANQLHMPLLELGPALSPACLRRSPPGPMQLRRSTIALHEMSPPRQSIC